MSSTPQEAAELQEVQAAIKQIQESGAPQEELPPVPTPGIEGPHSDPQPVVTAHFQPVAEAPAPKTEAAAIIAPTLKAVKPAARTKKLTKPKKPSPKKKPEPKHRKR